MLFHGNNGYVNASQWYVTHTLPALLRFTLRQSLHIQRQQVKFIDK